jgi:hypothetical protein
MTISNPTVEFVLPNPTPMHAFQMIPIQSLYIKGDGNVNKNIADIL